jgi:hypothetical protein
MGPKSKKKSKAELEEEKLQREEEQRKAKIAEDKRQAEEKEKKRQELAKLAAEQKALREKELLRWNEQYAEIADEIKSSEQQLQAEERQEEAQLEWLQFKEPTDEPNAEVEKDMNTFLSLALQTNLSDFKETMQYIKRIEKLAKAVEDVWVNSVSKRDFAKRDRALRDLQTLHELSLDKIDQATLKILCYYEKHINDKYIMHIDEIASQISVGFWASYEEPRPAGMKRPQPWEALGAHLEVIPKNLLQQSDRYVFRVIRTPIVTYNLRAYHDDVLPAADLDAKKTEDADQSRPRNADPSFATNDGPVTETKDTTVSSSTATAAGEAETRGEHAEPNGSTDSSSNLNRVHTTSNSLFDGAQSSSSSSPSSLRQQFRPHQLKYVVGDLIHFEILVAPPPPFQLRVKRWTMRDAGKNATHIRKSGYPTSSYCKLWLRIHNTVVMSDDLRLCVWDAERDDWVEDGIAEFQYNETLRMIQCNLTTVGVFALVKNRTVDLPLKQFKLFPVVSRQIHRMLSQNQQQLLQARMDGEGNMTPVPTLTNDSEPKNKLDSTSMPSCVSAALQKQSFRGLPHLLPPDEYPSTANPSGNVGEEEVNFFTRNHLGSVVPITYERYSRLIAQTRSHELTIDIVGSQVCLVLATPSMSFVEDMIGVPMSPASLFYRLLKKGINLMPTDVDLFVLTKGKIKHRIMENEVWQQVASCASALDFQSATAWNQSLSESQLGLLAREATVYACPGEENEYECILVERDEATLSYQNTPELGLAPGPDGLQYALVMGNEYGKRKSNMFSPLLRPGEERHLELKRTLVRRISPEAMERIGRVNQRFKKTVHNVLQLLKLYSLT